MGNNSKSIALALILIMAAASLMMAKAASAQSIPKPSVPEFTLKFVDRSYDVPVSYSSEINPYTGKEVKTVSGGYRIENQTIDITIKNQNFAAYEDENAQRDYALYYNVSFKGHYAGNWSYYPTDFFSASNSDYTIVTFGLTERESTDSFPQLGEITEGQVDFRVQALIGYYTQVDNPPSQFIGTSYHYEFTGQTSDWSNTQTITIPAIVDSASPSLTSSSTAQVPEFPSIAILSVFLLVCISLALALKTRKLKHY